MDVLRSIVATAVVLTAGSAAHAQGVPPPPSASLPTPEFLPTDAMDDSLKSYLET